jgi:hypothetical protein
VNKRSEEHGSRRNPRSVLRVPVISLNYSGVIPQHKLGSHSIINCGDRQSHLLPTSIVFFLLLLLLLPLYWPPTTRTRYNTTHAYHRDQKHHTVQSPRVLGQLLKGDTMPRKLTGAHTMMFPSWADCLCCHEGADETNKCSSDLGERFRRKSIPLDHLK